MQHRPFYRRKFRVGPVMLCALLAGAPSRGSAQQPAPGPAQPSPLPPSSQPAYRPPALALVQPAAGGSIPADRPVVVLRFAQGEPNDPIDVGSFAIAVDGHDRTRQFQVTATEAWGPLGMQDIAGSPLEAGAHQLAARICSARGACTELSATVSVVPPAVGSSPGEPADIRRRKVLAALLDAIKKLLVP